MSSILLLLRLLFFSSQDRQREFSLLFCFCFAISLASVLLPNHIRLVLRTIIMHTPETILSITTFFHCYIHRYWIQTEQNNSHIHSTLKQCENAKKECCSCCWFWCFLLFTDVMSRKTHRTVALQKRGENQNWWSSDMWLRFIFVNVIYVHVKMCVRFCGLPRPVTYQQLIMLSLEITIFE